MYGEYLSADKAHLAMNPLNDRFDEYCWKYIWKKLSFSFFKIKMIDRLYAINYYFKIAI